MIANLVNTLAGLVLVYSVVLHPAWIEQRYFPLMGFAGLMLVMALWARRSDPHPWFGWTNIVMSVALGLLALLPLATLPYLAFWVAFWVGCTVPVVALWSVLYRRDLDIAARKPEPSA